MLLAVLFRYPFFSECVLPSWIFPLSYQKKDVCEAHPHFRVKPIITVRRGCRSENCTYFFSLPMRHLLFFLLSAQIAFFFLILPDTPTEVNGSHFSLSINHMNWLNMTSSRIRIDLYFGQQNRNKLKIKMPER